MFKVTYTVEASDARAALDPAVRAELDALAAEIAKDPRGERTAALVSNPDFRQALTSNNSVCVTYQIIAEIVVVVIVSVFTTAG